VEGSSTYPGTLGLVTPKGKIVDAVGRGSNGSLSNVEAFRFNITGRSVEIMSMNPERKPPAHLY